jgi:hypothetical protein
LVYVDEDREERKREIEKEREKGIQNVKKKKARKIQEGSCRKGFYEHAGAAVNVTMKGSICLFLSLNKLKLMGLLQIYRLGLCRLYLVVE